MHHAAEFVHVFALETDDLKGLPHLGLIAKDVEDLLQGHLNALQRVGIVFLEDHPVQERQDGLFTHGEEQLSLVAKVPVLTDALFQFDKAKASDLLPGASVRLDQVAERLKAFKTIRQITVTGHADRLGSPDHNAKLSETRAATILEELKKRGVLATSSVARGLGETKPVTTDCSDKLARTALIQCLQPDRRVEIELSGQVR